MLRIVHINPNKKENPVEELKKILVAKWNKKNKEEAERKYGKKIIEKRS